MNILFVCTGNTCRSPMAEGIFRKMLENKGENHEVGSAGIYAHPDAEITPEAERQLEKRGISLSGRKSVQVTNKLVENADLVFTMTGSQRRILVESFPYAAEKIHLLGDYTNRGGDVSDPYGGSDETYAGCAAELDDMLGILAEMI